MDGLAVGKFAHVNSAGRPLELEDQKTHDMDEESTVQHRVGTQLRTFPTPSYESRWRLGAWLAQAKCGTLRSLPVTAVIFAFTRPMGSCKM